MSGGFSTAAQPNTNDTAPHAHPHSHPHPAPVPGPAMSAPREKFEVLDDGAGVQHRHRNWKKIAVIVAAALAVLALALGLGLGLGLKPHGGGGGGNSGGSSGSCSDTPNPTLCPNNTQPNSSIPTLAATLPWQIVLSETLVLANDTSATSDAADNETSTDIVTPNASSATNVTVYDIDMFAHQNNSVVSRLRAQGMHVICYFSAGSYEPGRPDSWKFTDNDKGKELDGWPGEYWLDLNSLNVRQIMLDRIEIAAQMNCSGIDPDNVDGYVSGCVFCLFFWFIIFFG
ncbi:glycoside hydrolase superfamily [Coniella lustricola]|uniref:alpha-galactosidase n=1 Tax=Coniella lustricola TaxID=2025994 RepID=A0A2T2ZUB9_9PEZI|nr:glycoside hydrolase superfamily [Coniella lustricola]